MRALWLLALLPMAGCANISDDDDTISGLEPSRSVPLVMLPGEAGRIVGVSETRSGSSITQTIALRADPTTPGQNQVVVTMKRTGLAPRIRSADMATEMAKALPGVPMSITNTLSRNAYGPYGYALGRKGDQTCLYGWQSVGASGDMAEADGPLWSGPRRSMTLRVRVCRARTTPAALAALMQGIGPAGTFGVPMVGGYGTDALAAASGIGGMAMTAPAYGPAVADLPLAEEDAPAPRRRVANTSPAPVQPAPIAAVQPQLPQAMVPQLMLPQPMLPQALPAQPLPQPAPSPAAMAPVPAPSFAPIPSPVPASAMPPVMPVPLPAPTMPVPAPGFAPMQAPVPAATQPAAALPVPAAQPQPAAAVPGMPLVPLPQ